MTVETVSTIPLFKDSGGIYRVTGSRVTLDLIVRAFNRGATAEEIAQDFPAVELADVYQVIGYYLKNASEFNDYFEQRANAETDLIEKHRSEWQPAGLRQRLLARRNSR